MSLSYDNVTETIDFARNFFQASAGVMLWLEQDLSAKHAGQCGLTDGMLQEYFGGMDAFDPVGLPILVERRNRVSLLREESAGAPSHISDTYRNFMLRYGMTDRLKFLFWQDERPFGVLAIMKRRSDPVFVEDNNRLETIGRYLESNLRQHPRIRQIYAHEILKRKYGLTPREIDVVDLLEIGSSNAKISEIMQISVPTVKTYVVNILNKIGVENRASIVAFVSAL